MANVPHRRVLKGHKECINCIDSTTSSRNLIASGSDDKSVRLWDIRTNKAIKCVVQCFESSVEAVKFSVSNDNILFAASSNSLFNFDLRKDGIIIKSPVSVTTDAATDEINTIAVSMSGDFVAVGDDSGVATILETNNLKSYKPKRLNGHNSLVNAIAFSPVNPNGFVTGGFDCLLSTWDLDNPNSPKSSVNMAKLTLCTESTTKSINPPFVQNLSYIFQGQAIVVALGDGSVKFFTIIFISNLVLLIYAFTYVINSID
jgi:WD40 repeat protein